MSPIKYYFAKWFSKGGEYPGTPWVAKGGNAFITSVLSGKGTPSNIACFVRYLKIFNTFCFEKWYAYLEANCMRNGIAISVRPTILELLVKTCKVLFWSISKKKRLANWNWYWNKVWYNVIWYEILMPFLSFSGKLLQDAYMILQKRVRNFETASALPP